VYVILTLVAMLSFCSLAVDWGRVQTSKTELRRAVDAAARAGAACLPQGLSSIRTEAISIAGSNNVNGAALTLTNSNIQMGIWNKSTGVFSSSGSADNVTTYQAVQVQVPANQVKIPLLFGTMIGMSTCSVTATSVAALVAEPSTTTQFVSAHGDPWLAGEPAGTQGSVPDPGYDSPSKNTTHPWKSDVANPAAVAAAVAAAGSSGNYTPPTEPSSTKLYTTDYSGSEPYGSPSAFQLTLTPGSIVTVSILDNSNNLSNNQGFLNGGTGSVYADGTGTSGGSTSSYSDDAANPGLPQSSTTTSGTEHGLSNIIIPINSVVGVFMDQNGATYGADSSQETTESSAPSTPNGLDFSLQSARDYTSLEPQLNQTFYVGDGSTSTGTQQIIVVPPNASALFLGTMDGHEWSNNVGGFTATITQYQIQIVR